MADVKLGNKIYSGVERVKLNTPNGGVATYKLAKVEGVPAVTDGIYSVTWDYTNPYTKLTRGDDAAFFDDPVPAAALSEVGTSPFDGIMPWAGMKRYNVVDGEIAYSEESEDFSMTDRDTVVYIPEFYYKVEQDEANGNIKWSISPKAADGFEKHPGSGRYVGRYHTSSNNGIYNSYSERKPVNLVTRATMRINSHSKGDRWWMLDIATWSAIQILYLVEFADWDSQTVLGTGRNDGYLVASGSADSAAYHTLKTNSASNQYRWIEDPLGSVQDFVDGFVSYNRAFYIGTDNASFGDTTAGLSATGVTLGEMGTASGSRFITMLGISDFAPWAFLPKAAAGIGGAYIPDECFCSSGECVMLVGGHYYSKEGAGLFQVNGHSTSSAEYNCGSRLIYIP